MTTTYTASFDIGVKNLAYCIVEKRNNIPIQIHKWNVINLIGGGGGEVAAAAAGANPSPPPQCVNCATTSSRAKKAVVIKAGEFFCKKCALATNIPILTQKQYLSISRRMRMTELREFIVAHIAHFSVDPPHTVSTKAALITEIYRCIDAFLFVPIGAAAAAAATPQQRSAEYDMIFLGREMTRHLDAIFTPEWLGRLTQVYVENQMATVAMRMKTIQGMLTEYFIIRGGEQLIIRNISATRKLKLDIPGIIDNNINNNNTYEERKKKGICICETLLQQYNLGEEWYDFFCHYGRKRDDLADSFLQGLVVI